MEVRIEPIRSEFAKDTWYLRDQVEWEFTQCDTPLPATYESECRAYERMGNVPSLKAFAIIYNEHMVGMVKLKKIGHGTAEVSYYLLRYDLLHNGITKQAVRKAVEYAFEELKLDMVYLYINHRNTSSFALAVRLGFYSIGTPYYPDIHRLEMTRTDYQNKIKEQYG